MTSLIGGSLMVAGLGMVIGEVIFRVVRRARNARKDV
jgi:hypothetical protein